MTNYPSYDKVNKAVAVLRDRAHQHWLHHDLFTWRWWLQLALAIVPWFIWWRIVDRTRRQEILLYGFSVALICVTLDDYGRQQLWWGYPYKLLQMVPPLLPADITLVPIYLMIVYQYFNKDFKTFLIASIIAGAVSAYIFEPIFVLLNFYALYTWKLVYSWLFYIVSSVISRWIVIKMRQDSLRL